LKRFPDSVNFYKMLAKLYVWNNQPMKAIPIYEKIIQLEPFDTETMIELAQQLVWNNQQLKAIPIYKKLVKIFPDSLNFHWMLCQLLVWNNKIG
jgi:predicted Zn-dependent protease